jgi:hypothetical protein
MGFSPRDVRDMSVWQYAACSEGIARSREPAKTSAPSDEEFFAAVEAWA